MAISVVIVRNLSFGIRKNSQNWAALNKLRNNSYKKEFPKLGRVE